MGALSDTNTTAPKDVSCDTSTKAPRDVSTTAHRDALSMTAPRDVSSDTSTTTGRGVLSNNSTRDVSSGTSTTAPWDVSRDTMTTAPRGVSSNTSTTSLMDVSSETSTTAPRDVSSDTSTTAPRDVSSDTSTTAVRGVLSNTSTTASYTSTTAPRDVSSTTESYTSTTAPRDVSSNTSTTESYTSTNAPRDVSSNTSTTAPMDVLELMRRSTGRFCPRAELYIVTGRERRANLPLSHIQTELAHHWLTTALLPHNDAVMVAWAYRNIVKKSLLMKITELQHDGDNDNIDDTRDMEHVLDNMAAVLFLSRDASQLLTSHNASVLRTLAATIGSQAERIMVLDIAAKPECLQ